MSAWHKSVRNVGDKFVVDLLSSTREASPLSSTRDRGVLPSVPGILETPAGSKHDDVTSPPSPIKREAGILSASTIALANEGFTKRLKEAKGAAGVASEPINKVKNAEPSDTNKGAPLKQPEGVLKRVEDVPKSEEQKRLEDSEHGFREARGHYLDLSVQRKKERFAWRNLKKPATWFGVESQDLKEARRSYLKTLTDYADAKLVKDFADFKKKKQDQTPGNEKSQKSEEDFEKEWIAWVFEELVVKEANSLDQEIASGSHKDSSALVKRLKGLGKWWSERSPTGKAVLSFAALAPFSFVAAGRKALGTFVGGTVGVVVGHETGKLRDRYLAWSKKHRGARQEKRKNEYKRAEVLVEQLEKELLRAQKSLRSEKLEKKATQALRIGVTAGAAYLAGANAAHVYDLFDKLSWDFPNAGRVPDRLSPRADLSSTEPAKVSSVEQVPAASPEPPVVESVTKTPGIETQVAKVSSVPSTHAKDAVVRSGLDKGVGEVNPEKPSVGIMEEKSSSSGEGVQLEVKTPALESIPEKSHAVGQGQGAWHPVYEQHRVRLMTNPEQYGLKSEDLNDNQKIKVALNRSTTQTLVEAGFIKPDGTDIRFMKPGADLTLDADGRIKTSLSDLQEQGYVKNIEGQASPEGVKTQDVQTQPVEKLPINNELPSKPPVSVLGEGEVSKPDSNSIAQAVADQQPIKTQAVTEEPTTEVSPAPEITLTENENVLVDNFYVDPNVLPSLRQVPLSEFLQVVRERQNSGLMTGWLNTDWDFKIADGSMIRVADGALGDLPEAVQKLLDNAKKVGYSPENLGGITLGNLVKAHPAWLFIE